MMRNEGNNLKSVKVKEELSNKLVYEMKVMRDGFIKSIMNEDLTFTARYASHKLCNLRLTAAWMKKPLIDISVQYERKSIKVNVDINKHYDIAMIDIKTGEWFNIYDSRDIYLYIIKCLHLPHKRTLVTVNHNYSRQVKPQEILFKYETESYKDLVATGIYYRDINVINSPWLLFQMISHGTHDNLVEEYLPTGHRILAYDDNGNIIIENIIAKSNTTIIYSYDRDGKLIKKSSDNPHNVTTYEYNDNGRHTITKVNGEITEECKYLGMYLSKTVNNKHYLYEIDSYIFWV